MLKPESANRITANILRVINMTAGGAAVAYRINNTGIWDIEKKIFRKSHTEEGLHDIWVVCYGFFLTIEVKAKRDTLKPAQKKRAFEITRAKGTFFEARSTDAFVQWWPEFLSECKRKYQILNDSKTP